MLILTKHAKERMRERGISKKAIEKVLYNPDQIRRDDGMVAVSKKINGKNLELIYAIENSSKIIITCYYI